MGKVVEVEETREDRAAEITALIDAEGTPSEDDGLWQLNLPGKEPEICGSEDEWMARYAELLLSVSNAGSLPVEERRTKMKSLEDCNGEGLERIDQVVASELKKKRKTYNRALAKERVPGEEG